MALTTAPILQPHLLLPIHARSSRCWGGRRLGAQLGGPALALLQDHIVAGRSILPGAAMFEMAAAAGRALGGTDWQVL